MHQSLRVLVTGSAGRVGRSVCRELLRRGLQVRGLDRVPSPGLDDAVVGNLTDRECVDQAVEERDALIHLAATPDESDFLTQLLPNNIVGLYHVLEASRQAGVRRLLLASSGQVVTGHAGPWPATPAMPTSPRNWYASAKVFAEAIGQAYAYRYGMSVIAARLGWCPRDRAHAEDLAHSLEGQDEYLSPGDAGRFFACALECSREIRFAALFATSRPRRPARLSLVETRALIGYEPQDTYPEGLELEAP